MADAFTLAASESNGDVPHFDFTRRDLRYVTDNNNLSYQSGQLIYYTQPVTQGGTYTDWNQSFIMLPLCAEVNLTGMALTSGAAENAWIASLKNGTHQLVHQLTVKLGSQIINKVGFNNLRANYEILTEASYNDLVNFADTMFLGKDSNESQIYATGAGECNNAVKDVAFNPTTGFAFSNKGRRDRMLNTSVSAGDAQIASILNSTANNFDITYLSYCKNNASTSQVGWVWTCIIPLRIISPFFRHCPATKGAIYEIQIDTCCPCTSTVTYNGSQQVTGISTQTMNNGTFPAMLSPVSTTAGSGFVISSATAGTASLSLSIGKSVSGATVHQLQSTRLYLSQCTMSPEAESQYLASPVKTFIFKDMFNATPSYGVPRNGAVDFLLHQGISAIRGLLIYPFISASANGNTGVSSLMSPLSSCPGTCSSMGGLLTNFNVLVGGQPLYQQALNYRYENFLADFRPAKTTFGGSQLGDSVGLISQKDQNFAYGMWYVDLSRHGKELDGQDQAIRVQFTNSSPSTMDYYYQIIFDRSLSINVEQGVVVV